MKGSLSAAESILQSLGVWSAPDIDLEPIAWSMGIVGIRLIKLHGYEARVVGARDRAIISVSKEVSSARRRFSIGHEMGHWHHHRGQRLCCKASDIGELAKDILAAKEKVANRFASDILLPPYLVKPMLKDVGHLRVEHVVSIAAEFRTSFTATARKLTDLSPTPTMLICHGPFGRKWHHQSLLIPSRWFPKQDLDLGSPAAGILDGRRKDQPTPRRVNAQVWFDRYDASKFEVLEQSFRTISDEVLTLLTFNDPGMLQ